MFTIQKQKDGKENTTMTQHTFMGYKRQDGRVGIRNHVVILPLDDISNAAAEGVANNIAGTISIPHAYGRLQFGEDLELHFRTIIGTGKNPNVAAVVVIGIEPGWTKKVVEGIAATGKPVEGYWIEQNGDIATIAKASKTAQKFVQYATEIQREECPISDLWVAVKCGESDTTSGLGANPTVGNFLDKVVPLGSTACFGETTEITGGEHLVMARAASDEARDKFKAMFDDYAQLVDKFKTSDLSDSQPTKGNIEGGLTTIEEKALGNIQKIGKKIQFVDALNEAEEPSKGPGLYFMNTSSAAAECNTLQAAAGFALHLFPTGQGNVIGNPIMPVIKLTANPRTIRTMSEHVDVDVSDLLTRKMNLDQAGDKLLDMVLRTCNGRNTCAETLRHREFIMTKLYRSA